MIGMTVCSGIGAPECAAPWIDWRYQSEIEPFPCAVLKERFPDAVNLGDMTRFKDWPNATVDVLCGGTPCQSFSVAGLRKGLDDPRGNLMLTHLAIAGRYRPRWLVWENVPGVLSSNGGRDFGSFLGGLGQLGYGFAYRVLDAQYTRTRRYPWAVPQRRRRVFVVGYLGDWRRAAAVLFDAESLSGNPPPRREAGSAAAALTADDVGTCGADDNQAQAGHLIPSHDSACTLTAHERKGPLPEADLSTVVAQGPIAFGAKSTEVQADTSGVAPPLRAMSHSGSHANAGGHAAVAFAENDRAEVRLAGGDGQVASQLTAGGGKPGQGYPAVAIQERATSENVGAGPGGVGVRDDGAAYTLEARQTPQAVATPWAVRRLMPIECERLMGFPDNWTKIPYRNKPADKCPDGPRYKALGNSMAINCMEWIFDKIREVDAL